MNPDVIFWIASMTKPVTSVAAMMLVEEGKLDLDAPVSRYLPGLKDMQVAREVVDPVTGGNAIARRSLHSLSARSRAGNDKVRSG
jgi:CubicO group peptidase (beta-lactamase class C family)